MKSYKLASASLRNRLLATAALTLAALSPHIARADFQENFTLANGAGNKPVADVGWQGYLGAGATNVSSTTPSGNTYLAIAGATGNPGPGWGYLAALNNVSDSPTVFTVFKTGLDLGELSSVTWNMNASNPNYSSVRLLVQVNNTWYATSTVFSPRTYSTTANFNAASSSDVLMSFSFNRDAATWRNFDFTAGVGASIGSTLASDLPLQSVTGIGFFINASSNQASLTRIDSISVVSSPIPEPSSAALLLGTTAILGAIVRRRRR